MKKFNLLILSILLAAATITTGCVTSSDLSPFTSGETETEGQMFMLNITSNIEGSHIYVNGNFMGNNSIATHFRGGSYRIEVKAAGYKTWQRVLVLDKSWTLEAELTALPGLQ